MVGSAAMALLVMAVVRAAVVTVAVAATAGVSARRAMRVACFLNPKRDAEMETAANGHTIKVTKKPGTCLITLSPMRVLYVGV